MLPPCPLSPESLILGFGTRTANPTPDEVEAVESEEEEEAGKWWGLAELVLAQDLLWKDGLLRHCGRLVVLEAGKLCEGHSVTLQAVPIIQRWRRDEGKRVCVGPVKSLAASAVTRDDLVILHEPNHYSATAFVPYGGEEEEDAAAVLGQGAGRPEQAERERQHI